MKKAITLVFFAAATTLTAMAQEISDSLYNAVMERGVYEQKRVIQVDGASASTLYGRAREALSDWTGTDGRSQAGLDYCDKDAGVVTYKGRVHTGNPVVITKTDLYTDFTIKVRCKDGRAQVTVTVPSLHMVLTDGQVRTFDIREVMKKNRKASASKVERAKKNSMSTREVVDMLLKDMEQALKNEAEDDF